MTGEEWFRASAAAQGLPEQIEDEVAAQRIASLVREED